MKPIFKTTGRVLVAPFRWLTRAFDMADVLTFVGLGALGYGVHQIHEPAAYIVTGAILLALGIKGSR